MCYKICFFIHFRNKNFLLQENSKIYSYNILLFNVYLLNVFPKLLTALKIYFSYTKLFNTIV